jgi:hypothetical protein
MLTDAEAKKSASRELSRTLEHGAPRRALFRVASAAVPLVIVVAAMGAFGFLTLSARGAEGSTRDSTIFNRGADSVRTMFGRPSEPHGGVPFLGPVDSPRPNLLNEPQRSPPPAVLPVPPTVEPNPALRDYLESDSARRSDPAEPMEQDFCGTSRIGHTTSKATGKKAQKHRDSESAREAERIARDQLERSLR